MDKRMIIATVQDTHRDIRLNQSFEHEYDEKISVENYKELFLKETMQNNKTINPVVVSLSLTVHDEDGNYKFDHKNDRILETLYELK